MNDCSLFHTDNSDEYITQQVIDDQVTLWHERPVGKDDIQFTYMKYMP